MAINYGNVKMVNVYKDFKRFNSQSQWLGTATE